MQLSCIDCRLLRLCCSDVAWMMLVPNTFFVFALFIITSIMISHYCYDYTATNNRHSDRKCTKLEGARVSLVPWKEMPGETYSSYRAGSDINSLGFPVCIQDNCYIIKVTARPYTIACNIMPIFLLCSFLASNVSPCLVPKCTKMRFATGFRLDSWEAYTSLPNSITIE